MRLCVGEGLGSEMGDARTGESLKGETAGGIVLPSGMVDDKLGILVMLVLVGSEVLTVIGDQEGDRVSGVGDGG